MHFLFITFEFPPQGGGIGTFAYQMAKELNHTGYDVSVLALSNHVSQASIEAFDDQQKFRILRYKEEKNRIKSVLGRFVKTLKCLKTTNYDLVFIANVSAGVMGVIAKIFFKVPFVIMGHGSEFLISSTIRKLLRNQVYKQSSMVFVNSQYTLDLLKKAGIKHSRFEVIALGADPQQFCPKNIKIPYLRQNLGISPESRVLLTVGSISERKSQTTVIRAIKILAEKYPDLIYVMVGRGPLEKQVVELSTELKIKDKIILKTNVSHDELSSYYALCDIYMLTSVVDKNGSSEGFGISIIEANLMGKPAIGTKNCGIEDAIENLKSGILVDMKHPQQTAEAISQLLDNPQKLANMGAYAKKRALESYTWEKVASKVDSYLQEIIKKKNS